MKQFKELWKKYKIHVDELPGHTVPNNVNWYNQKLADIKGVMIGQDPYFYMRDGKPVASNLPFVTKTDYVPFSLSQIKKAYDICATALKFGTKSDNGLNMLRERGVLFLYAIPTTKLGTPMGHNIAIYDKDTGQYFLPQDVTTAFLKGLFRQKGWLPVLAMGNEAEKVVKEITKKYYKIIHPAAIEYGGKLDLNTFRSWLKKL